VIANRYYIAWVMIFYAVILGIYTGILLSAFNARPLWNTSLLGPLFLVSGMSTATAVIMWMAKNPAERRLMSRIDLLLIGIELFFIVHLFMGFLASSAVQINAAELFLGGQFTVSFWVFVIILGLIFPAVLEILEMRGVHIPIVIPVLLVLFGGLMFRFIMVEAGQITRFLY
jgi:protein NrfD